MPILLGITRIFHSFICRSRLLGRTAKRGRRIPPQRVPAHPDTKGVTRYDFSYIPLINEALETDKETQGMWMDMEIVPSDLDGSDSQSHMTEGSKGESKQTDEICQTRSQDKRQHKT